MSKGGKSSGKIAFSIAGFALGGLGGALGWWGASARFMVGAMYGMSIASTIWSVSHQQSLDYDISGDYSNEDSSRFDTVTNEISNSAVIPLIYGTRKWGGLQVWHNPYNSQRNLQKDVLVCEGNIKGVYDVAANDDLIKSDTNISIYNTLYSDATVSYEPSGDWAYLVLRAGGTEHKHYLQNVDQNNTQTAEIINALLVDEWNWTISHAKHYDTCHPGQCTYTIVGRNDVVIIVTTMIGLIGGLIKVQLFVIPILVNIIMKCIRKRRNNIVHPSNHMDISVEESPDDNNADKFQ